ncbi:hypothetical protein A2U01_0063024, partial [Trifolium medium]|nr:hypothetical protein [Trifolium medium]
MSSETSATVQHLSSTPAESAIILSKLSISSKPITFDYLRRTGF